MTPACAAETELRAQVRHALTAASLSQAEAARSVGCSTKHLSQMLTGRATLSLDWAERLLDLCGMRIVIGINLTPREDR